MTITHSVKSPRKLIEVALPLNAINAACKREKSIRHGHPSTLHLWWARRPLAAARAVIFAQMVNDPGYQQGGGFKYGVNKKEAALERKRLFDIIRELVLWENTNNEAVLEKARTEIRRSWKEICELNSDHPQAKELFNPNVLPGLHDPFAGGGTIPMEAQRLGLAAYGSDLNPVAVVINKAMIEIPSKFNGLAPANPDAHGESALLEEKWCGAEGLAEDIQYYGQWVRKKALERIGHLYPPIRMTEEITRDRPDLMSYQNEELTIIAWIWARTVKSPNPAFSHVDVPLIGTFVLSSKKGKEAYVEPIIKGDEYQFKVRVSIPPDNAKKGTTAGKRKAFRCLLSDTPIGYDYIREQGKTKGLGVKLVAIVAQASDRRVFLSPTKMMEELAFNASPSWKPELSLPDNPRDFKTPNYGMKSFEQLFTDRQLVALTTFSELTKDVREQVKADAIMAGYEDDSVGLACGGTDAFAYSEAISVFLALATSRTANTLNSLTVWSQSREQSVNLFSRQAIPMAWDFPEVNPFAGAAGDFGLTTKSIAKTVSVFNGPAAYVAQQDAQTQSLSKNRIVSTDPPYYDNVGYADLSDFFYVWLRPSLRDVYPELFTTIAVPKAEELVATPYRHSGKKLAESFFLNGMAEALGRVVDLSLEAFPVTIYYAFKQAETGLETGTSSTGWETFLAAIFNAGLGIIGTWPMRTERPSGVKSGMNALASSIVLVCRKRPNDAPAISRREFIRELNQVLPEAIDNITRGIDEDQSPIAPVDLSQAIIGPGMAVFSKYSAVLEADGEPMTVRTALQLINRFLAEDDFDKDTQFCLHWFEQYGWNEGVFGEADVLARAKATSVDGLYEAGVIESGGGKVRLFRWSEYPTDWDPEKDLRTPVWEALHHLIRGLKQGGESAAGKLLAGVQSQAEAARQLAYRLYTLCERKGWAEDARAYNELITSWSAIETAAPRQIQRELF